MRSRTNCEIYCLAHFEWLQNLILPATNHTENCTAPKEFERKGSDSEVNTDAKHYKNWT